MNRAVFEEFKNVNKEELTAVSGGTGDWGDPIIPIVPNPYLGIGAVAGAIAGALSDY